MDYLSLLICLLLAWVAIHFRLNTKKSNASNPKNQPPGPSPLPIFGNLFSLGTKPHVALAELAKTYGPVMILQLGQVPTAIISSPAAAKEALQKNDISLSSRMVVDAVRARNYHENSVAWLPTTSPAWRNLRKICNSQVFSNARLDANQSLRKNKVEELVSSVEKSSQAGKAMDIGQAAFTTSLNLLSNTFFSVDLGDSSTEFAREYKLLVRSLLHEAGKPNFADYFPFLRKIDPQGIRRRMSIHSGKMINLFNTFINQRLQGNKRPSDSTRDDDVLDELLGKNKEIIDPSNIPYLLIDLFTAGTDTTSSTLEWAMAELLRNPEKQQKAKAELEEIIGKGNPVEEPDIAKLPYLQAIVKETLRLHPPLPLLLPRKADSDVNLMGYTVPKNTQLFVNVHAIGRDPNIWENPNLFEPERFLGTEIDVKGRDFELIPFGAGRRICPGMPLAIRMIHLMLGSLIHNFEWKLEGGILPEEMDMEDRYGFTVEKAHRLRAIPVRVRI